MPTVALRAKAGFTLLEVLLVIAIMVALTGVALQSINVQATLTKTRDAEHAQNQGELEKAVYQNLVDKWVLPQEQQIPEYPATKPICTQGVASNAGCVNLDEITPIYLQQIPRDTREMNQDYSGYVISKRKGRVRVIAAHLGEAVGQMGPPPPQTLLVSAATDGTQGNSTSYHSLLSANGRYVVFDSNATNLVPGDTNGQQDVFLRDRQTNTTTRVSVASDGTQGDNTSGAASISDDGRYVAFTSHATTLVANDTNGQSDVFLRDLGTSTTTRLSVAPDGITQANGESEVPMISADGLYVAFESLATNLVSGDVNGQRDVFLRDLQTAATTLVSVATGGTQGNGGSSLPGLTADGRFVTFSSLATNLVAGDTNGREDVFLHDRQTNITTRVSVASDGTQGNQQSYLASISATGNAVAFLSFASNLVTGDTNGFQDVFVRDLSAGTTTRESVASDGTEGNHGEDPEVFPSINSDGSIVGFSSPASTLVTGDTNNAWDVFLRIR